MQNELMLPVEQNCEMRTADWSDDDDGGELHQSSNVSKVQ